ncbi:MAG TPA: hypothetical protein VJX95_02795, partial [Oscillospiraceae bacterium]|nr:hypothetical protein [Oscillospiraceae bacterium]
MNEFNNDGYNPEQPQQPQQPQPPQGFEQQPQQQQYYAPQQPQQQQYYGQIPQPAYAFGPEIPQKKSKVPFVILMVAIGLVAVAGIMAALYFFVPSLKNSINQLVLSPQQYYGWVERNTLASYEGEVDSAGFTAIDENSEFAYDASVTLTLGDALGIEVDDIGVDITSNCMGGIVEQTIAFKLGGTQMISIDAFYSTGGDVIYIQIPELSEDYLSVEIKKYLEDAGVEESELDEKQLKEAFDRYIKIILDNIGDVEKSSTTVSFGSSRMDATALKINLTKGNLVDLIDKLITQVIDDKNAGDPVISALLAEVS